MAGNRVADARHKELLELWALPCIDAMRAAARGAGYALGVHGSLAYDIDVIAVPWAEDAVYVEDLIPRLRSACTLVTGLPTRIACFPDIPEEFQIMDEEAIRLGVPQFAQKPHGRTAWVWQLGGGVYVDCSVFPPKP